MNIDRIIKRFVEEEEQSMWRIYHNGRIFHTTSRDPRKIDKGLWVPLDSEWLCSSDDLEKVIGEEKLYEQGPVLRKFILEQNMNDKTMVFFEDSDSSFESTVLEERLSIIEKFGEKCYYQAMPELKKLLLYDSSERIRYDSALVIGHMILKALLYYPEKIKEVKKAAFSVADVLLDRLADRGEDKEVRQQCANSLGEIGRLGYKGVVKPLIDACEEEIEFMSAYGQVNILNSKGEDKYSFCKGTFYNDYLWHCFQALSSIKTKESRDALRYFSISIVSGLAIGFLDIWHWETECEINCLMKKGLKNSETIERISELSDLQEGYQKTQRKLVIN
jgi:hypothetical protein